MYVILVGVIFAFTWILRGSCSARYQPFISDCGVCKLRREAELPTWGKIEWERGFS